MTDQIETGLITREPFKSTDLYLVGFIAVTDFQCLGTFAVEIVLDKIQLLSG